MTLLSKNEKEFLRLSLNEGNRLDGRNLIDHRAIEVLFGVVPGEVELHLGQTIIFTKISSEITEPKPERPNEGFLRFHIDLNILNDDPQNKKYSVKEYSNEISKIIERAIKGSKALDVDSLCIISGKSVWSIKIDSVLINNGGNLIDSFYLSCLIGLLNYRKPFVKIEAKNEIKVFSANDKQPVPLSITHIPISFTFAFFNDTNQVVADPINLEEEIMDGRITIIMNIFKDICLIHKPGGAPLSPDIFEQLIKVCELKVVEITYLIRDVLCFTEKHNILNLKEKFKINFDWKNFNRQEKIAGAELTRMLEEKQKEEINLEELKKTLN